MKDYYKILETNKSASQEEIKQKYRELAKKWHPDANGNSKESEERFKDIAEAYSVLSSPDKKREYDESIFQNSYTRRSQGTYQNSSWNTEEETPFYTFYYTSNKSKKKNENSGSILKGLFQIVVGIVLFRLPGFFPFLGIYSIFSGIINIKRVIKLMF
ncbi:MAG: DnaJ domain-containing protein [Treponema sp.]